MSQPSDTTLQISRILHAGYLFRAKNVQIAFDPIFENPFSVNCHAYPSVEFDRKAIQNLQFDAVFISHHHDDHCSLESLHLLNRATPLYLYCIHDELFSLLHELGFAQVFSLSLDEPVKIGPLTVTPHRAINDDVDSIFEIQAFDLKILNMVDSSMDEKTQEVLVQKAPWDLVLWPFQVMREVDVLIPTRADRHPVTWFEEWTEQLQGLAPRFVVPSSCQLIHEEWSWYRHAFFPVSYGQFSQKIQSILPRTSVQRMDPGTSVFLNKETISTASSLDWIFPVGQQEVDYDYRFDHSVQSVREIAKRFPPLNEWQMKKVFDFCQHQILNRYFQIGPPTDPFFQKRRVWKLSLFNQNDPPAVFYYQLRDEHMEKADPSAPHWTTEICAYKLFCALERGETLTSLYLQVNTETFANEVETELQSVDPMEDPLIRALYNGVFASYQKAQFSRIKNG